MVTKVFGKIIETMYDVDRKQTQIKDTNGDLKTVFTAKPKITKVSTVKEWGELCSFNGEPRYNSRHIKYHGYGYSSSIHQINISEKETVSIEEEIFRADLNELHVFTDKIIETKDINKEAALSILDKQVKAFNKAMIKSNDRLKAYCDLHKLSYEKTDCIELFKLVFPDNEYTIKDGVMMPVNTKLKYDIPSYKLSSLTIGV